MCALAQNVDSSTFQTLRSAAAAASDAQDALRAVEHAY